jgi:hypothetical protein
MDGWRTARDENIREQNFESVLEDKMNFMEKVEKEFLETYADIIVSKRDALEFFKSKIREAVLEYDKKIDAYGSAIAIDQEWGWDDISNVEERKQALAEFGIKEE